MILLDLISWLILLIELSDWLTDWSIDRSIGLIGWLIDLTGGLIVWIDLISWLYWSIDWSDWLGSLLIDCSIWLIWLSIDFIEWSIDRLNITLTTDRSAMGYNGKNGCRSRSWWHEGTSIEASGTQYSYYITNRTPPRIRQAMLLSHPNSCRSASCPQPGSSVSPALSWRSPPPIRV